MVALKIIAVALGLAFAGFGYLIVFRKRYSPINGFEEDFRAGRKTEAYAKKVGWTELALGLVLLLAGVLLIIFA